MLSVRGITLNNSFKSTEAVRSEVFFFHLFLILHTKYLYFLVVFPVKRLRKEYKCSLKSWFKNVKKNLMVALELHSIEYKSFSYSGGNKCLFHCVVS